MSERAKRLGDYLTEKLGWTIWNEKKKCMNCGYVTYKDDRYCGGCGKKYVKHSNHEDKIILDGIEKAISWSLSNKPMPRDEE